MKRFHFTILMIVLFSLSIVDVASAQGMKKQQQYQRMFDVNSVETIEGTILQIKSTKGKKSGAEGIHIMLDTGNNASMEVHLGPAWFIDQQETPLKKGDSITVTGSRVQYNNSEVIIASVIKRGNMEFRLRNNNGIPLWRAWRKQVMRQQ